MAIVKCRECGNEISTKADACPKCGAKAAKTSGCGVLVLILIGLLAAGPILGRCSPDDTDTPATTETAAQPPTSSTAEPTPAPAPTPPAPGSQWLYAASDDPMGKGAQHTATVTSTNTVEFAFPYSKPQHGVLALRSHPRYGKEVLFGIERGQILCNSYEDCSVLVRFDDEKAMRFAAIGPSDNSSTSIFIRDYPRFYRKLIKAKTVRISVDIYQQGAPVFEFDISGFDPAQYLSK